MKFTKGLVVGGLVTTGLLMMYNNKNTINKNKIVRRGRKIARKMGIL